MGDPDVSAALRSVGANIRAHRLQRGWSHAELAEAIGVEPLTVRWLESAKRSPSFATLVKLLAALEIEPNALFVQRELEPNPRGRPKKKAKKVSRAKKKA